MQSESANNKISDDIDQDSQASNDSSSKAPTSTSSGIAGVFTNPGIFNKSTISSPEAWRATVVEDLRAALIMCPDPEVSDLDDAV
jgi:hypothetical protein